MAPHFDDEGKKPEGFANQDQEPFGLAHVKEGPFQHPPFEDAGVRRLLRHIQGALAEVQPLTVDEWEDSFRRDSRPSREIATWLHIAAVYHYFTKSRPGGPDLSPQEKREVFSICLTCSLSGPLAFGTTHNETTPCQLGAEVISKYYFDNLRLVSDEALAILQRYFRFPAE